MKTIAIPAATHARLKIHCDKHGLKIQAFAAKAVEEALARPIPIPPAVTPLPTEPAAGGTPETDE